MFASAMASLEPSFAASRCAPASGGSRNRLSRQGVAKGTRESWMQFGKSNRPEDTTFPKQFTFGVLNSLINRCLWCLALSRWWCPAFPTSAIHSSRLAEIHLSPSLAGGPIVSHCLPFSPHMCALDVVSAFPSCLPACLPARLSSCFPLWLVVSLCIFPQTVYCSGFLVLSHVFGPVPQNTHWIHPMFGVYRGVISPSLSLSLSPYVYCILFSNLYRYVMAVIFIDIICNIL